jgi:intracellular multiplication protein IcmK
MPESFLEGGANPILINILDGVPPSGSLKLNVSGNYGEAWTFGDKLYFRTRLTVLSPAWLGTVSSPDGMHVYEMMNTPTVLASKDGQTVDIRLTG